MNAQFLKSFDLYTGRKELELFHREKQFTPKEITEADKKYIKKYLLKSEYIESTRKNSIIVATSNSKYVINFYIEGITIHFLQNCSSMLNKHTIKRYLRYDGGMVL